MMIQFLSYECLHNVEAFYDPVLYQKSYTKLMRYPSPCILVKQLSLVTPLNNVTKHRIRAQGETRPM